MAVVGIDDDGKLAHFYTADGVATGTIDLPETFTPEPTNRATRYVYGLDVHARLWVLDAATRHLVSYDTPSDPDRSSFLLELDGTAVAIVHSGGGVVGLWVLDLATGATTDILATVGQGSGRWDRYKVTDGALLLDDSDRMRAIVVPRARPAGAFAVDGYVTSESGGLLVALRHGGATGQDVIVDAYRKNEDVTAHGAFAALDGATTLRGLAAGPRTAVVIGKNGAIAEVDTETGATASTGDLGYAPSIVTTVGPNLAMAIAKDDGDRGQLVLLHPFTVLAALGVHWFQDVGSGERCAMVDQFSRDPSDAHGFVIDGRTGAVLGDLGRSTVPLSGDGCSGFGTVSHRLMLDGHVTELASGGWAYDVSIDQKAAVLRGADGITRLVATATMDGPVLPVAASYSFVDT